MPKKIKVLMVDDEEQFRSTTKKILNSRGFETILAGSGEEAIEKLSDNPDVVILDIKMPGMDGHQVLRKIKKRSPSLPVIMLTGHGAMPSAKEAFDKGAYDYLLKPCDLNLLAGKISDAYYHSKTKDETVEEKRVMDVMIPIADYTKCTGESTIKEAVEKLRESFSGKISTSRIMETGHRSLLVFDLSGKVEGILAITDLLSALMPSYLSVSKPSIAKFLQYSPIFWKGIFTREVKKLAPQKIKDIISPALLTIDANANLMEATHVMMKNKARRLAVIKSGDVVGVVREQDLFFEIDRILKH